MSIPEITTDYSRIDDKFTDQVMKNIEEAELLFDESNRVPDNKSTVYKPNSYVGSDIISDDVIITRL